MANRFYEIKCETTRFENGSTATLYRVLGTWYNVYCIDATPLARKNVGRLGPPSATYMVYLDGIEIGTAPSVEAGEYMAVRKVHKSEDSTS